MVDIDQFAASLRRAFEGNRDADRTVGERSDDPFNVCRVAAQTWDEALRVLSLYEASYRERAGRDAASPVEAA